ncbi:hypothetical protein [Teredinibacter purpureus]|uniref:hypothetical protein n=1 Tax=Teredinibacter purpureus TaxID=2731756 RepID=UPI0005F7B42A|nr:hypothetical protein [Teredinibacter purpureus]
MSFQFGSGFINDDYQSLGKEETMSLLAKPTHIIREGQNTYTPLWSCFNSSAQTILQDWYRSKDYELCEKLPQDDVSTLHKWLFSEEYDSPKIRLRSLLKGKIKHVTPSELAATGFYLFDSDFLGTLSFNTKMYNTPQPITFTRRSKLASWDIEFIPFTGKVISVTTRLRISNSGLYFPNDR